MDDSRLKVEFPLGDELKVVVHEPTSAQGFVLMLALKPGGGGTREETVRLVHRMFAVVEALVTQEVWDSVIEQALIHGRITEVDLMQFVRDIARFNWGAHRDEEQKQIESEEPDVVAMPARPEPRVIRG